MHYRGLNRLQVAQGVIGQSCKSLWFIFWNTLHITLKILCNHIRGGYSNENEQEGVRGVTKRLLIAQMDLAKWLRQFGFWLHKATNVDVITSAIIE